MNSEFYTLRVQPKSHLPSHTAAYCQITNKYHREENKLQTSGFSSKESKTFYLQ